MSLSIDEPAMTSAYDLNRAFGMDISDRVINRRDETQTVRNTKSADRTLTTLLSENDFSKQEMLVIRDFEPEDEEEDELIRSSLLEQAPSML